MHETVFFGGIFQRIYKDESLQRERKSFMESVCCISATWGRDNSRALTLNKTRTSPHTSLHQQALARRWQSKQILLFVDQSILTDDLGIAEIDARTHWAGPMTRNRIKFTRRMRRAVLAMLRQFTTGVRHVTVGMIIVVSRRRWQPRFSVLQKLLQIHGEMLKHHAIYCHCWFRKGWELSSWIVPPEIGIVNSICVIQQIIKKMNLKLFWFQRFYFYFSQKQNFLTS